ncbi:N-carbamoyl-L-amino acid hydrolase [Roseovarius albus]|uniref:N-carbamoyl-L-amino acid hydrolase n=1 Tax=Roseovarius albus TaxID=1247867 RepID=A0A1X6Y7K5_9RHOB|nr:Zn-dependent hydrolase [Roseovarius albus]SLN12351.1 N-carbamoyl-L-amino acid hydrolase [Roseovarius albus]
MTLTINAPRLWNNLMQIANIGGTPDGGCDRQALTDTDLSGRELFIDWCVQVGLKISYDAVGNMFARLDGQDNSLSPIVLGSHLDTQPTGGKYDGILGVLAGLEVVRCIREAGIKPNRPVEIANWMNEEGARFAPAMMGSGVYAGMLDLAQVRDAADKEGITVGQELDRHGYSGFADPTGKDIHAYLELHIEQGPVLEQTEKTIGVVTGAQGIRWYDVSIRGQEVHAGPFPMGMRRDPVAALPEIIAGVLEIGRTDEHARATIGQIDTCPGSRNVVPGQIEMSIDLRHPDEAVLTSMNERLEAILASVMDDHKGLKFDLNQIWHSPVVDFDAKLVKAVLNGALEHGCSHLNIISGAGHDALMVARKAPTTMIFIPCKDGLSHNPAESATPEHVGAGANVLLSATLELLN